jgi:hypothetical protein
LIVPTADLTGRTAPGSAAAGSRTDVLALVPAGPEAEDEPAAVTWSRSVAAFATRTGWRKVFESTPWPTVRPGTR